MGCTSSKSQPPSNLQNLDTLKNIHNVPKCEYEEKLEERNSFFEPISTPSDPSPEVCPISQFPESSSNMNTISKNQSNEKLLSLSNLPVDRQCESPQITPNVSPQITPQTVTNSTPHKSSLESPSTSRYSSSGPNLDNPYNSNMNIQKNNNSNQFHYQATNHPQYGQHQIHYPQSQNNIPQSHPHNQSIYQNQVQNKQSLNFQSHYAQNINNNDNQIEVIQVPSHSEIPFAHIEIVKKKSNNKSSKNIKIPPLTLNNKEVNKTIEAVVKRLNDKELAKLFDILSNQEKRFGENMLSTITDDQLPLIDELILKKLSFMQALEYIFNMQYQPKENEGVFPNEYPIYSQQYPLSVPIHHNQSQGFYHSYQYSPVYNIPPGQSTVVPPQPLSTHQPLTSYHSMSIPQPISVSNSMQGYQPVPPPLPILSPQSFQNNQQINVPISYHSTSNYPVPISNHINHYQVNPPNIHHSSYQNYYNNQPFNKSIYPTQSHYHPTLQSTGTNYY